MFGKLAALAKKPVPKGSNTAAQRREREEADEEAARQQKEADERLRQEAEQKAVIAQNKNKDDDDNSDFELDLESQQKSHEEKERNLVEQLPRMIALMEQKLIVAEKMLLSEPASAGDNDDASHSGKSKSKTQQRQQQQQQKQTEDAEMKAQLANAAAKDDVCRLWCLAELSRWRREVLTNKFKTDSSDVFAMTAAIESVRAFELSMREITPLLDGLKSHSLPPGLADGLYKAVSACRDGKFLDAEQHYFDSVLSNNNWHIGLAQSLHVRAQHTIFQKENVKSIVHNTELRKMMVVFKALMTRQQMMMEQQQQRKELQEKELRQQQQERDAEDQE